MDEREADMACSLAVARLKRAEDDETIERELAILREAADAGYRPAQYAYACWLDTIRADSLGGIPYLIQAARRGHAEARHELFRRYAGQKKVRALVQEQLSSEDIAALGLTEGNWLTRMLAPNEVGTPPIMMLIGLLFLGGVFVYMLAIFARWYELWLAGESFGVVAFIMLSIHVTILLFCLGAVVGVLLEWHETGSSAEHPLSFIVGGLFGAWFSAMLLAWGWYGFSHWPGEWEYAWIATIICTLLGLVVARHLFRQMAVFWRILNRRGR